MNLTYTQSYEKYKTEIEAFKWVHGYDINLKNPKSFNEKIVYKKLFDRNPLIPPTADKYKVRDYIRQKIGDEATKYLVPILWTGKNPDDIPFRDLPDEYIIKPNNASARYILKSGDYKVNRDLVYKDLTNEQIVEICKDWFKTVHGEAEFEWAYSQIDPVILIEKVIKDKGELPNDYRFYMFDGKLKFVNETNFRNHVYIFYDENWNHLNVCKKGYPSQPANKKPLLFGKMVEFAEKLSEPFDFARIDFFPSDSWFYFSEITHYVGSGRTLYEPPEFDFELGKYWNVGSYNNHI
jgi:hypothetical protein